MKNTLKLHLYGYTVQGTDRRDGSVFEDFTVMINLDGTTPTLRIEKIIELYGIQGYEVTKDDVLPDDNLENRCWKKSPGIEIELNFNELYRQNQASAE